MPIVYVYGFPPRMELEQFKREFFNKIPDEEFSSQIAKIDYKKEKIYAFIHTHTMAQAEQLINQWNDKPMEKSGENTLQVRLKTDAPNPVQKPNQNFMQRGGNNRPRFNQNQGMSNNMGHHQNSGHRGPRPNFHQNNNYNPNYQGNQNNFHGQGNVNNNMQMQPQNNYQNRSNNRSQNSDMSGNLGPQKPVLYVYGFPKETSQLAFEDIFLAGFKDSHKQTDYFQEKIYCFIHCKDNETCDDLIEKWDGQTLPDSEPGSKPLQVRYKGLDSKAMSILTNIAPVLWVYGYPKNTDEMTFKTEFLTREVRPERGELDVEKVDYFEQKLYAFVHCKDWKMAYRLINKWEGKMMPKSKNPIQVRFKNLPNQGSKGPSGGGPSNYGQNQQNNHHNNNNFYGNQNQNNHQGGAPNQHAMGDMNQQNIYNNQTFGNQGQAFYNNNMNQNNMNRNNQNNQNNMNFQNHQINNQMNFNNRPQFNNMNQMQAGNNPNFNMGGRGNWNQGNVGQMHGGPMQGNFGGQNDGFRGKPHGGYNNRGQHPNFQQNQMNDGNFGRNQIGR